MPQRVVLVTGASSGIGEACASLLAARGFTVYAASRRAPESTGVHVLRMDVCDDASVRQSVAAILDREGRLDAVVNNAGIGVAGAIEDTSTGEAVAQFDVNFFGVLRVCREVLPIMRKQRGGHIVNIGSIGGLIAIPFQGLYSASKFAVEGFTEALRMEVRPFGIRAVIIEPGDHRTQFTERRRRTLKSTEASAYSPACEHAIARMARDEQNGSAPERVARLVHQVLNTRDPRLRYTVGPAPQRAVVWLKRLMPHAVIEKLMSSYYAG
jgi:NAD(P)-dependent dehydrogenase (short-subunit alcohol dehydrogenase family)